MSDGRAIKVIAPDIATALKEKVNYTGWTGESYEGPNDTGRNIYVFPSDDGRCVNFGRSGGGEKFVYWYEQGTTAPMSAEEIAEAKEERAADKRMRQNEATFHVQYAHEHDPRKPGLLSDQGYAKKKGMSEGTLQAAGCWQNWAEESEMLGIEAPLTMPIYNRQRVMVNRQKLHAERDSKGRDKFIAKDAEKIGCSGRIGKPEDFVPSKDRKKAGIAEGLATSGSVYEATGMRMYVALDCGNLAAVAAWVKEDHPNDEIYIFGDDDALKTPNEGRLKATAAAKAIGATVVFPQFVNPGDGTDFNDVHLKYGLKALKAQLSPKSLKKARQRVASALASIAEVDGGLVKKFPLTELGNALRLLFWYGEDVRYVTNLKMWIVWRDGAWVWDRGGVCVLQMAMGLARKIYEEGLSDFDNADKYVVWSLKSQKEQVIKAAVELLKAMEQIRIVFSVLDADSMLVGLDEARSVIDLKTREVRAALRADYITKSMRVRWVGESPQAVVWRRFLDQVFMDDQEVIDWIQMWCGYQMTALTIEQMILIIYGLGSNGKTVLGSTIQHIMGDYARAMSASTLATSKRQAGGASPDLVDLAGARLAVCEETSDGDQLAEGPLKNATGGNVTKCRQIFGFEMEVLMVFKLLVITNHRPTVRGTDEGIWRRLKFLEMKRIFSGSEKDKALSAKLLEEAPHIVAWMLEGCLRWQRIGLETLPKVIEEATREYRSDQDVVGRWLGDCCVKGREWEATSPLLYASYSVWCAENGHKPVSNSRLGRQLAERRFKCRRSNGKTIWEGVGVVPMSPREYSSRHVIQE